ncbi:MAG: hypothetical protein K9J76_06130 [Polaromonas sp.]|nr:hypothetical protein [Polaromonas sp.]
MHETPFGRFPVRFTMTFRTFVTQGAVVFVVFFVATDTVFGSLFEQGALVTLFALHLTVLAQQRKAALVMVKPGRLFPATFAMAADTVAPQGIFVFVILGMTGMAILTQSGFVQWLFMACGAACRLVLATQRIFGVRIMVKGAWFPGIHAMTGFTFLTILTLVPFVAVILLFVTTQTGARRFLVLVALVAVCASGIQMLAFEGKFCFAVVKLGFFPILFSMAIGAFGAQGTFVGIVFFMATVTGQRGVTVLFTALVTLVARQRLVLVTEQKICLRVIKLLFVKASYLCIPTLVIGMASAASLRF